MEFVLDRQRAWLFGPGIALLLLPVVLWEMRRPVRSPFQLPLLLVVSAMLALPGGTFTGFSVLNDYTHTGMLRNTCVEPGPQVPVDSPDCTRWEYR